MHVMNGFVSQCVKLSSCCGCQLAQHGTAVLTRHADRDTAYACMHVCSCLSWSVPVSLTPRMLAATVVRMVPVVLTHTVHLCRLTGQDLGVACISHECITAWHGRTLQSMHQSTCAGRLVACMQRCCGRLLLESETALLACTTGQEAARPHHC